MTPEPLEYRHTNHIVVVKTHGMRCLKSSYREMGVGRYKPKGFSTLTVRFENPTATAILFATGNITIMGPCTYWGALYVLDALRRKLDLSFALATLTNIVTTFSVKRWFPGGDVDIDRLYRWRPGRCVCDQKLFPCCTYNVPGGKVKANIFRTGSVVLTGCRDAGAVRAAIGEVLRFVTDFLRHLEQTPNPPRKRPPADAPDPPPRKVQAT